MQRQKKGKGKGDECVSLNLGCKDLVPQKGEKGKAVSVLIVLATGLSLCAEQRVDFV